MSHTIYAVPIFKIGTHNGREFSQDDLKEMVANFYALKKENPDFQIPIKVGHDDKTESEKPAIGWMDNLKVEGQYIVADFTNVSDSVLNSFKEKQYKNRSVEILKDFVNSAGKKMGRVISGIAVLGSSLPAVNLPDIRFKQAYDAVLCFEKELKSETETIETEPYEIDEKKEEEKKEDKGDLKTSESEEEKNKNITKEVTKMDNADSKENSAIAPAANKENEGSSDTTKDQFKKELLEKYSVLENFTKPEEIIMKLHELEMVKKEKEKLEGEKTEMQKMQLKADYETFSAKMVEGKRLLPKHQSLVNLLFSNLENEKQIDVELEFGRKEKKSLVDLFKLFISDLPEHGLLSSFAQYQALSVPREQALEEFAKNKGFKSLDEFKKQPMNTYKKDVAEFETLFSKRQASE